MNKNKTPNQESRPVDERQLQNKNESGFAVGLDDAERERLAMLAEECGEVIQVVGKILRHGFESHHPNAGADNRCLLEREVGDIQAVIDLMIREADVNRDKIGIHSLSKLTRILRWTHFQKNPSK